MALIFYLIQVGFVKFRGVWRYKYSLGAGNIDPQLSQRLRFFRIVRHEPDRRNIEKRNDFHRPYKRPRVLFVSQPLVSLGLRDAVCFELRAEQLGHMAVALASLIEPYD